MDKRLRNSFKGHSKKNANTTAAVKAEIELTTSTTSTQIPATTLACDSRLIGSCPATPTEAISRNMSNVALTTQSKTINSNIQNQNGNTSRPQTSKLIASPMEHMVAADVQAKATSSRNKNEGK